MGTVAMLSMLLLLSVSLQTSYGSLVLTKVTTVTGDGDHCGWITVELIGINHETCSTEWLDNSGQDDMEPGHTDEFTGDVLGTCKTTAFADGLFQYVVHHHGFDGWCMHSVALEFDNGETADCVADIVLDEDHGYRCPGHNK